MSADIGGVAERGFEWPSATPDIAGLGGDIHLWFLDVNQSPICQYDDLLNDAERQRAGRIAKPDHRQLYVAGRLGLRMLVAGYTGLANDELKFALGSRGKPRLSNRLSRGELNFNYTVSAGYALYALAWNAPLGVDLECLPRKVAAESMARRKLTAVERKCWQGLSPDQRNDAMLACWTRKEAYGKLLGVGIRYFLNRVELFTDLGVDHWTARVDGLFDPRDAGNIETVSGVQVGLPVPGVASLMYASVEDVPSRQNANARPLISSYNFSL